MTGQKMSLDELINLAKEFDKFGKWRVMDKGRDKIIYSTEKVDGLFMSFGAYNIDDRYTMESYSICLKTLDVDNARNVLEIEVVKYYHSRYDKNQEKDVEKLKQLHDVIHPKAYVIKKEEDKKRQEEQLAKQNQIEGRKNQAVETARKLINKSQYK